MTISRTFGRETERTSEDVRKQIMSRGRRSGCYRKPSNKFRSFEWNVWKRTVRSERYRHTKEVHAVYQYISRV